MLGGIDWKTVAVTLLVLFLLGMLAPGLRRKVTG